MASSDCIGAKPRRLSRAVPETIELNRDALTPCCLNTLLGIGARTPPAPYRVLIRKPHEIAMPFLLTRRKCRPMAVRAEPVSALYGKEQDGVWVDGRIRHVGAFPEARGPDAEFQQRRLHGRSQSRSRRCARLGDHRADAERDERQLFIPVARATEADTLVRRKLGRSLSSIDMRSATACCANSPTALGSIPRHRGGLPLWRHQLADSGWSASNRRR